MEHRSARKTQWSRNFIDISVLRKTHVHNTFSIEFHDYLFDVCDTPRTSPNNRCDYNDEPTDTTVCAVFGTMILF